MAYTYAQIETEVRANVNSATASVATVIDQAINLLSNLFSLKKIATGNTTANQSYIAQPSLFKEIERLTIDEDNYKLTTPNQLTEVEDFELKRCYAYNGQIKITPTPESILAYILWYKCGFTPLAGVGTTDVPDKYVPLLIILATWLFWGTICADVNTARELFPDMTPEEAKKTMKEWKQQFDQTLNLVKKQK